MTCYQIHIVHGTGPLGAVCQCERNISRLKQLIANIFQLINGLRYFYANLFKNGLVVENIASAQSAVRNGKYLSIVACLCNRCINVIRMVISIEHIRNIIYKSGLVILYHRAAAPVNIHIRSFSGTHCYNELLLVCIILLCCHSNLDVRIISLKSLNSSFYDTLTRILCGMMPEHDLHRLCGQLRNILCFLCSCNR